VDHPTAVHGHGGHGLKATAAAVFHGAVAAAR